VLAYVKNNTLETVGEFDSLPLRAETTAGPNGETAQAWEGEALFVLIGNCRRFTGARTAQANVEDGLLEVTIVEDAATTNLLGGAALEGLFGQESTHIVRRRTPSLAIESRGDSVEYSLDGEMLETERLQLETEPKALTIPVGDGINRIRTKESCGRSRDGDGSVTDGIDSKTSETRRYWFHEPS